jgi:hypothetical protein
MHRSRPAVQCPLTDFPFYFYSQTVAPTGSETFALDKIAGRPFLARRSRFYRCRKSSIVRNALCCSSSHDLNQAIACRAFEIATFASASVKFRDAS